MKDLDDLKETARRLMVQRMRVLVAEFPVPPVGAVPPEKIEHALRARDLFREIAEAIERGEDGKREIMAYRAHRGVLN